MATNISSPISFTKLYELKHECCVNKLENELYNYLYELLDSINTDVLKQNKIRHKQYLHSQKQKTEPTNNISTVGEPGNWRTQPHHVQHSRLSLQLSGVDKIKLALNRELNKLSPMNADSILDSILEIFMDYVIDYIKQQCKTESKCVVGDDFTSKWMDYTAELWTQLMSKILSQLNMTDTYFKFIAKLINITDTDIIDRIESRLSIFEKACLSIEDLFGKVNFDLIYNKKTAIITEMLTFLNTLNYLTNEKLDMILGFANTTFDIDVIFNIMGKFIKCFMDLSGGYKKQADKHLYDALLAGLRNNFRIVNDLLQWEPLNKPELEKRIHFIIGFFQDNKKFIQALDTDFYRDVECQLDGLKKSQNIPSALKYKLFDCIDSVVNSKLRC